MRSIVFLKICLFLCFGIKGENIEFKHEKVCLSIEESAILDRFFRALIEEAEGGYVLYDQKPICAHAFFSRGLFLINSPWHSNSVALKEGSCIWKKLLSEVSNSNFSIFVNAEEKHLPGWIHISLVNRALFLKVVSENLSLFQYVLGPKVTPDGLLKNLASSFGSTFNEDKALIGLALGFGRTNSLYVSRLEHISDYLTVCEDIPIKYSMLSQGNQLDGLFLFPEGCNYDYKNVSPSFGFDNLLDEMHELENDLKISSEKLETISPKFIFGRTKDAIGEALVDKLEKTQDQICSLLQSTTFLQDVLEKILNKTTVVCLPKKFRFAIERDDINKVVARGIWHEELQHYDRAYIPYFLDAFSNSSEQMNVCDPLSPLFLKDIAHVQENLIKTTTFFQSLAKQNGIYCIEPKKLYYKVIKEGEGNNPCTSPQVRLGYTCFDSLGHSLKHQSDISLNLNSAISGFAHAVKGMKKGETREVYIHPSIAYGLYTPYEKGLCLRMLVTLHDIYESEESFPELTTIDLSFLENEEFRKDLKERYKNTLIWRANVIGAHLNKSKDLSIAEVKKYLVSFLQDKELIAPLAAEEENLINKVHWNIYFGT